MTPQYPTEWSLVQQHIIKFPVYLVYELNCLMYTVPINNKTTQRSVGVPQCYNRDPHDEANGTKQKAACESRCIQL